MAAPLARGLAQTAPAPAPVVNATGWNLARYLAAMEASGRPISMTQESFDAIQARKPAALALTEAYLKQHLGKADPLVMQAFAPHPPL